MFAETTAHIRWLRRLKRVFKAAGSHDRKSSGGARLGTVSQHISKNALWQGEKLWVCGYQNQFLTVFSRWKRTFSLPGKADHVPQLGKTSGYYGVYSSVIILVVLLWSMQTCSHHISSTSSGIFRLRNRMPLFGLKHRRKMSQIFETARKSTFLKKKKELIVVRTTLPVWNLK